MDDLFFCGFPFVRSSMTRTPSIVTTPNTKASKRQSTTTRQHNNNKQHPAPSCRTAAFATTPSPCLTHQVCTQSPTSLFQKARARSCNKQQNTAESIKPPITGSGTTSITTTTKRQRANLTRIKIIVGNIIITSAAVTTMQRFCSFLVLGAALCVREARSIIPLPSLAYGYCDLEPYISCEVSHPDCW